jgi:2-hydroxychromene-2-carboxylate isomerase
MRTPIEFFFDFGSGPSYLGYTQMSGLCERTGAELVYRPILLGGVFKLTGNTPPGAVAEKMAWFIGDLQIFAAKYGVTFGFPKIGITNTMPLMRGAYVALEQDRLAEYCQLVFSSIWVEGLNMQDVDVFAKKLASAGFDAQHYMDGIARQEIKDALIANTQEAVDRGAFGLPTFFTCDRMFFGQDRLEFVEQAVLGELPGT